MPTDSPDEPKILSRIGRVRNRKVISRHTMPINLSKAWQSKWTMHIGCAVLLGGLIAGFTYRLHGRFAPAAQPVGAYCESGIGAARGYARGNATAAAGATWTVRINDSKPPGPAPPGMVWIPSGQFWMGVDDEHMADAKPWHRVYVDGYWMDKTDVTNQEFTRFVKDTSYQTIAERKPRAEDFPGAPPENLVEGAVVFTPPANLVELNSQFHWWKYVPSANWRHPEGPASGIENRMNHPVVEIAYQDAVAYCKWAGKRLPTEAEFEFASRGGLDRKRYVWGDEVMPRGRHMANTFQGHFPDANTAEDGYAATAPVGSFPANGYGLFDMSGNVWEWASDWYRADYYQTLAAIGQVAVNPKGPAVSFDPSEPGVRKRVQRGGSFLCADQYCSR